MKPAPASALVVPEPDLLLELLVIPLNAPAQFGLLHEGGDRGISRQGREPILRRLLLAVRPLHQEPLLGARLMQQVIAMSGANSHGSKARGQRCVCPLPPWHDPPSLTRQSFGEVLG